MAKVLSDLFSHPFPQTFNRVEVWTVGRQLDQFDTQLLSLCANDMTAMPRSTIPDNDQLTVRLIQAKR